MKKEIVILAAGIGSRLRPMTDNIPKAMVKVNGIPILKNLLDQIFKIKTEKMKVNIVTGYCSKEIEKFTSGYKDITLIENKVFDITNNMYSLNLALDIIDKNSQLIIINADCFYDFKIVKKMIAFENNDVIAVDKNFFSEESMKVKLNNDGYVNSISKNLPNTQNTYVSMDFYTFSSNTVLLLKQIIRNIINSGDNNSWTEVAIDILSRNKSTKISSCFFSEKWIEIDDLNDLKTANKIFRDT